MIPFELPDAAVQAFLELADGLYEEEGEVYADLRRIVAPCLVAELQTLKDEMSMRTVSIDDVEARINEIGKAATA